MSDPAGPDATPTVLDPKLTTSVTDQIVALHRFFEQWFRAELANDDASFAFVTRALGEGFVLVSPTGQLSERDALLQGLRGAHGSWGADDAIWIEDVTVRRRTDGMVVATYAEWQRRGGQERGRLSTVVFSADLTWLHVHETWLPDSQ